MHPQAAFVIIYGLALATAASLFGARPRQPIRAPWAKKLV